MSEGRWHGVLPGSPLSCVCVLLFSYVPGFNNFAIIRWLLILELVSYISETYQGKVTQGDFANYWDGPATCHCSTPLEVQLSIHFGIVYIVIFSSASHTKLLDLLYSILKWFINLKFQSHSSSIILKTNSIVLLRSLNNLWCLRDSPLDVSCFKLFCKNRQFLSVVRELFMYGVLKNRCKDRNIPESEKTRNGTCMGRQCTGNKTNYELNLFIFCNQ